MLFRSKGPFKFNTTNNTLNPVLCKFWDNRYGINLNKETQYILYKEDTPSFKINKIIDGFNEIHVYYDDDKGIQFYYNLAGHGTVRFTSQNSAFPSECFIPLISGTENKIVCHDLPGPLTFYKTILDDTQSNVSKQNIIEDGTIITNNGTANGKIIDNTIHELRILTRFSIPTDQVDLHEFIREDITGSWKSTELGEWCLVHAKEITVEKRQDMISEQTLFAVMGYLTPKQWTEFCLRFS